MLWGALVEDPYSRKTNLSFIKMISDIQVKPRILIKLCSKYEAYFYPKIEDYRLYSIFFQKLQRLGETLGIS